MLVSLYLNSALINIYQIGNEGKSVIIFMAAKAATERKSPLVADSPGAHVGMKA